jgi:uncharacterized membrane protein
MNQSRLPLLREIVTAFIATTIVVGAIVLVVATVRANNKDAFENYKTILLLVNTPVGIIVGFYFNKTVTDTHLERAEASTAQASALRERADAAAQELRSGLTAVLASNTQGAISSTDLAQRALDRADKILGRD